MHRHLPRKPDETNMEPAFSYAIALPAGEGDPLAACTLGIEVSVPALAAQCGPGNVDPQHEAGALSDAPAAIEACLDHPLPPRGSRLLTIRTDADALGAMAVLELRAAGTAFDAVMQGRVALIAAADRFDRKIWPGPRTLPTEIGDVLVDSQGPEISVLAACAFDRNMPLADRVAAFRRFLVDGMQPHAHRSGVIARAAELLRSLVDETTRVTRSPSGRVANVILPEPGALMLGCRLAPVVVALHLHWTFADGATGRKFTVARWHETDADLTLFKDRICALEPGWGGQAGIVGSPQFAPWDLSTEQVVAEVDAIRPDMQLQD